MKSILSTSEHDQVMSQQVVILKQTARSCRILKLLEFYFGCLAVVELIVIASLQIDTNN